MAQTHCCADKAFRACRLWHFIFCYVCDSRSSARFQHVSADDWRRHCVFCRAHVRSACGGDDFRTGSHTACCASRRSCFRADRWLFRGQPRHIRSRKQPSFAASALVADLRICFLRRRQRAVSGKNVSKRPCAHVLIFSSADCACRVLLYPLPSDFPSLRRFAYCMGSAVFSGSFCCRCILLMVSAHTVRPVFLVSAQEKRPMKTIGPVVYLCCFCAGASMPALRMTSTRLWCTSSSTRARCCSTLPSTSTR